MKPNDAGIYMPETGAIPGFVRFDNGERHPVMFKASNVVGLDVLPWEGKTTVVRVAVAPDEEYTIHEKSIDEVADAIAKALQP